MIENFHWTWHLKDELRWIGKIKEDSYNWKNALVFIFISINLTDALRIQIKALFSSSLGLELHLTVTQRAFTELTSGEDLS